MRIMLTVLTRAHRPRCRGRGRRNDHGGAARGVTRRADGRAADQRGPPDTQQGPLRAEPRLPRRRTPHPLAGRPPPGPTAPALGLLRDGDLVTLDRALAGITLAEEPGGIVEIRVVGGPAAGSVHRLSLGVHTIGSDPACAVSVPDPLLPGEAAVVRLTPDAITVEPAPGAARRRAAPGPRPPGRRGAVAEHALLTCGATVLTLKAVEPPDAHLDAQPDGGLAYNRPPRFRPPGGGRRFEVPAEPKRAETMRLQLLTAFLPAGLGLVMAWALQIWYFLLFALMTPLIMSASGGATSGTAASSTASRSSSTGSG